MEPIIRSFYQQLSPVEVSFSYHVWKFWYQRKRCLSKRVLSTGIYEDILSYFGSKLLWDFCNVSRYNLPGSTDRLYTSHRYFLLTELFKVLSDRFFFTTIANIKHKLLFTNVLKNCSYYKSCKMYRMHLRQSW